jgi:hypothetical protein
MRRFLPTAAALAACLAIAPLHAATPIPVRLVAPDTVNAPAATMVFNASLTTSHHVLYFSRAQPGWKRIGIFRAERVRGHWVHVQRVAFSDPRWRDTDPSLGPDGRVLVFASDRPLPGQPHRDFDYHLWRVTHGAQGWSRPQPVRGIPAALGPLLYPNLLAGGTLYFNGGPRDGRGIYRAQLHGAAATAIARVSIPGAVHPHDQTVSADGRLMVFAMPTRTGDYHHQSIYLSRFAHGAWTPPRRLPAAVNGPSSELATGLSRDGRTLYFGSYRPLHGAPAHTLHLYRADLGPWLRAHRGN